MIRPKYISLPLDPVLLRVRALGAEKFNGGSKRRRCGQPRIIAAPNRSRSPPQIYPNPRKNGSVLFLLLYLENEENLALLLLIIKNLRKQFRLRAV